MGCHGQLYASAYHRITAHLTDKKFDFSKDNQLDFDPMDEFMSTVLASIAEHGSRAVRVFPPPAQVIIYFAERLASEVVRNINFVRVLLLMCLNCRSENT